MATFSGLAGLMSGVAAVALPVFLVISLMHLVFSWHLFRFHQHFSNDHPLKGETVTYRLYIENGGVFPLAPGICRFAEDGTEGGHFREIQIPIRPGSSAEHTDEIRCSWRGTYTVGLVSVLFRDILGLFEFEQRIEPHVFYVYPELTDLDPSFESLAGVSGGDKSELRASERDPSIYEYSAPLRTGAGAERLDVKHMAATGIPAAIICGHSRSAALRIVLDLWPGTKRTAATLAAEDKAVTAVFSALRHLAANDIPATFTAGPSETSLPILSMPDWQELYEQSTSLLFSEPGVPLEAFTPGAAVLLVTTRPLSGANGDLFSLFEQTLARGGEPHLVVCPEKHNLAETRRIAELLDDRVRGMGARTLIRVIDPDEETREVRRALCP